MPLRRFQWLRQNGTIIIIGLMSMSGVALTSEGIATTRKAVAILTEIGDGGVAAHAEIAARMDDSRRALKDLVQSPDAARRTVFAHSAKAGDSAIWRATAYLAQLGPVVGERDASSGFEDRWVQFGLVRERVIVLAESGAMAAARQLEQNQAESAFAKVRESLHTLRANLSAAASAQERVISAVLWQMLAKTILGGGCTLMLVVTLRRQRTLLEIQQQNEQLAAAEQLERERGAILEMTGRHEPLPDILRLIVAMIERQIPGAQVVVKTASEPSPVSPGSSSQSPAGEPARTPLVDTISQAPPGPSLGQTQRLKGPWTHPVISSSGQHVGSIEVFTAEGEPACPAQQTCIGGAARLAEIAIQHQLLYDRLQFQARHDPLTALPNRRFFEEQMDAALHRAQVEGGKAAVLVVDLNRFKRINDLFGHRVGDAVLKEMGTRIASHLTPADMVARIGGDEFIILLAQVPSVSSAEQLLQRLAAELPKPLTILGQTLSISASIGLSVFPDHGGDAQSLVRSADLAMYSAKARPESGATTYHPELGALMLHRMTMEQALESALDNNEMEVHYQVIMDFERRIVGAEALLRWKNPVMGWVAPDSFLPFSEETGLLARLGLWVLDSACQQAASWAREGLPFERLSVNISASQLAQADFVPGVLRILNSRGLPGDHLELELTEAVLMQDIGRCATALIELRAHGITIAIDDFGTGFSSVGSLQSLPVNRVKIDPSFIAGLLDESRSTFALVRAIVDLAHHLGLSVTAEGVETEFQFAALRRAGCDAVQGFLFHQPASADHVAALLRRHSGLHNLQTAIAPHQEPSTRALVNSRSMQ